jgi:hypothetical protein
MPLEVSKTPDNHSKTRFLPLPVTRENLTTAETHVHKSLAAAIPGEYASYGGVSWNGTCSCSRSGSQNFEVATRLLKSLCTTVMIQRSTSNNTVHNRISILSNTLF